MYPSINQGILHYNGLALELPTLIGYGCGFDKHGTDFTYSQQAMRELMQ